MRRLVCQYKDHRYLILEELELEGMKLATLSGTGERGNMVEIRSDSLAALPTDEMTTCILSACTPSYLVDTKPAEVPIGQLVSLMCVLAHTSLASRGRGERHVEVQKGRGTYCIS
jgi:hypothetical protein